MWSEPFIIHPPSKHLEVWQGITSVPIFHVSSLASEAVAASVVFKWSEWMSRQIVFCIFVFIIIFILLLLLLLLLLLKVCSVMNKLNIYILLSACWNCICKNTDLVVVRRISVRNYVCFNHVIHSVDHTSWIPIQECRSSVHRKMSI